MNVHNFMNFHNFCSLHLIVFPACFKKGSTSYLEFYKIVKDLIN